MAASSEAFTSLSDKLKGRTSLETIPGMIRVFHGEPWTTLRPSETNIFVYMYNKGRERERPFCSQTASVRAVNRRRDLA